MFNELRDPVTAEVLSDRDYEAAVLHYALLLANDRTSTQRFSAWVSRVPAKLFTSSVYRFIWEAVLLSAKEGEPVNFDVIQKQLELFKKENVEKKLDPERWMRRFFHNEEALYFSTHPELMVQVVEALWSYWVRRQKRNVLVELSRLAEEGASDEDISRVRKKMDRLDQEVQDRTLQRAYDDEELIGKEFEEYGNVLGDRLIVKGGFHYLHARDGVGKSFCALQMAHAMCTADEWLDGLAAPEKFRVLFVQAEMTKAQLKGRVEKLKGAFGPLERRLTTYSERFLLARQSRDFDPVELGGFGRLEALVQRHKPDVVFIDPLISFTSGCNLNKDWVATPIIAQFLELAQNHNCAVVILHHEGKDREKGLRGSSTLRDEASCSIGMWDIGYSKPLVELTFNKARHRRKPPSIVLKRDDNGWFEIELGLTEYLRTAGRGALISKLFGRHKKKDVY